MTTGKVPNGKPDAGNPHVMPSRRFGVASRKALLFAAVASACASLSAATYVLKAPPATLADWKSGAFYEGGVAPAGVATDTIATKGAKDAKMVVEIDTATADGKAIVAFLNSTKGVIASNAVIKVTVPAGEVSKFAFAIWDASTRTGTLEKRGDGELFLAARLKLDQVSTSPADYEVHHHVFEGTVRLTDAAEPGHKFHQFHSVTVERPAKLITLFNDCVWAVRGLYGEGLITNEAASACSIYVNEVSYRQGDGGEFKGVLGGRIFVKARSCDFTLSGTANTFTGDVTGENINGRGCAIYLTDFGEKSRAGSSLGKGTAVLTLTSHPFVYLGAGQTTDRDFQLNARDSVLDAGTNGNLVYTGTLRRWDATKRNPGLFLAGDNKLPCTFAPHGLGDGGVLDEFERTVDGVKERFNYYFGKRGTGEWHFPFTGRFRNTGVLAVENGVLSFESIDRAGELTSLGYSTRLFENKEISHPSAEPHVGYAFLLGSDSASDAGLMACATNVPQQCTDRPFALRGRGGFLADCGLVKYANVFGVGTGEKTLVLSGANAFENEVHDVIDHKPGSGDTAVVSVEKNGPGTWVLGGDQTFSGSLTVNGGTLIVRRADRRYRRYRLMVMNMAKGGGSIVNINEIGLFASDNKSQSMNLRRAASHVAMRPGECAVGWNRVYEPNYKTPLDPLEQLFDGRRYRHYENADGTTASSWHALNGGFRLAPLAVSEPNPTNANPHTWIPIDMYLPDDALPIDHFDVQTALNGNFLSYIPNEMQLFASVDGIHWDAVSDVTATAAVSSATYCWLYGGKTGGGLTDGGSAPLPAYTHSEGWKTTKTAPTREFSLLENVGAVTVANGATLRYEGAADGAPSLSCVRLAAGATGTIDGFAFAESGTFEIDEMTQGGVSVGVALPNATGLGNVANWQVKVGGVLKPRYSVKATADGFTLEKSGLTVVIR